VTDTVLPPLAFKLLGVMVQPVVLPVVLPVGQLVYEGDSPTKPLNSALKPVLLVFDPLMETSPTSLRPVKPMLPGTETEDEADEYVAAPRVMPSLSVLLPVTPPVSCGPPPVTLQV
jgi:hypothetical protein